MFIPQVAHPSIAWVGEQNDLYEKPCHGVESRNPAPHPGIDERNSTLAIGFRASLALDAVRQSERARYYSENDARFMSPDWSAKVEPVPYAKLGDPQSLNLYGYMLDSPLDGVDQDGHQFGEIAGGAAAIALTHILISAYEARQRYKIEQSEIKIYNTDAFLLTNTNSLNHLSPEAWRQLNNEYNFAYIGVMNNTTWLGMTLASIYRSLAKEIQYVVVASSSR